MNELATRTNTDLSNPIGPLLEKAIEAGITSETVGAMKELMQLYRDHEAESARKQFARAFADLQNDLRPVQATREVQNKDGTLRYKYAAFEDLMASVVDVLARHGFSVSYDMDYSPDGKRLVATCNLSHVSGHSRTNRFAVRIGSGPPGTNEAQQDGAARTYARRLALCDALNIVVERDSDARAEGDTITKDEADALRVRVHAICGGDVAKMLKWMRLGGAESWFDIRRAKYEQVIDELERQEADEKIAPCPPTSSAWHDGLESTFIDKGKTPSEFTAFLKGRCEKYGVSSYLALNQSQREEVWKAVMRRA